MMGKVFSLQINTPSHVKFEGSVQKLFLRSASGELEILAHHENMIISTVPAVTRFVQEDGEEKKMFVSSSIVQIVNGSVKIFTDAAEFPDKIDFNRAEAARERAIERLKDAESYEKEIYYSSLVRAEERLKLK